MVTMATRNKKKWLVHQEANMAPVLAVPVKSYLALSGEVLTAHALRNLPGGGQGGINIQAAQFSVTIILYRNN